MSAFESEPNDDRAHASVIGNLPPSGAISPIHGSVNQFSGPASQGYSTYDPSDFYIFTINSTTHVQISIGDPDSAAAGFLLKSDGSNATSHISQSNSFDETLVPGTYYIKVIDSRSSISYDIQTGIVTDPVQTYTLQIASSGGANHAPVANDNSYSTNKNTALTISVPGVLGNDTDADFDGLTAVLASNPGHGTLSLNPNGSFTYTPVANFTGPDSFTYFANDGIANSTTAATVSITVTSTPQPHIAPTVNVQNVSVAANASIAASSMITSVSNPSSDNITAYEFIDQGSGGGYFKLGNTIEPANQWIEVLTTDLSSLQYVGGSSPGSESIAVAVYDFTTNSYSNFSILTATTTATPSDLFVVGNNLSATTVAAGGSITFSYWVDNFGTGPAPASQTGIYLSTDSVITSSDLFLASVNTPQLTTLSGAHGTDLEAVGITIPAGLAPGNYFIGAIGDYDGQIPESNENNNASVGIAIIVTAPLPGSVSVEDVTITEGNNGTKVETFTVTRSGGTAPFDVNYFTSDGSATTADQDYVAKAGTLHFDAGVNTQPISVAINGDTKIESNETFFVNLSGATNGATISDSLGIGTIFDDDGNHLRDFNADTRSDFLWRNDNGAVSTWDMHDRGFGAAVIGNVSSDWHIAGTGDFNGDRTSDLVWRNDNGAVATWDMHDRGFGSMVIANVSNDWHIAGTGDFNGDGTSDILWRNDNGAVATWDMHDRSFGSVVIANVSNDWHIAGTGDFNGDGTSDILWRNDNGAVATWDMHDRSFGSVVIANVSNDWHIAGTGDFNGDGTSDIAWRNDSGAVATWDMHDRSFGAAVIAAVPNDWHII
jgi:Bacterial Ig domain/Calx-beta domain/CARDB/FG-GAP-like repeat/FG-GAP repeat